MHFDEALSVVQNGNHSRDSLVSLLKTARVNKIRESRIVVQFGSKALSQFGSSLGDEKWNILEQVYLAAIDTGNTELANSCIKELTEKFKDSSRVGRLLGMQSEFQKDYKAASEIYANLLEENPANALALKRKVALLKAQGRINEAVKELNE